MSQTGLPRSTASPSFTRHLTATFASSLRKQASNHAWPHSTAALRQITVACEVRPSGVSIAVQSPAPMSSARAAVTLRSISDAKSMSFVYDAFDSRSLPGRSHCRGAVDREERAMDGVVSVVSYGLGTVIGLVALAALAILIVHDVTQK